MVAERLLTSKEIAANMDPNKLLDLISSDTFKDPTGLGSNSTSSKLKFLRGQRLSLDSRIDTQQIRALGEEERGFQSDQGDQNKDRYHRRSFDMGLFKILRRRSLPFSSSSTLVGTRRHSLRSRKKLGLIRQGESFDGVIPENIAVDHQSHSSQTANQMQRHRHSLDLLDLPSAIKQLKQSFKAIR